MTMSPGVTRKKMARFPFPLYKTNSLKEDKIFSADNKSAKNQSDRNSKSDKKDFMNSTNSGKLISRLRSAKKKDKLQTGEFNIYYYIFYNTYGRNIANMRY